MADARQPPGLTQERETAILPFEEIIQGFVIHRGHLSDQAQERLVGDVRAVIAQAPLVRPVTAWGKPMSVQMTSAGSVGWIIERGRYRYSPVHPRTGQPWPTIPEKLLELWSALVPDQPAVNSCLINWYGEGARMGLHQDRDEGRFEAPVVSVSLGDPCRFRMGGTERGDPTKSTVLNSGDVVVMGGEARLAFHGVDRIMYGQGSLLPDGGRINLTLRRVET